MKGVVRPEDMLSEEWVTACYLGCLVLIAAINTGSPRKWRVLWQAAFRMRLGRQALREELDAGDRTVLGLLAVAVVAIAMLLWQCAMVFGRAVPPSFLLCAAAVAAVLAIQSVLLRGLAFLAKADAGAREYRYTGSLLYSALGVALLPLVILSSYRPHWRPALLGGGLALLVMILLYRWVRCLWIGAGEGVPFRYIILYLCGAEILPLLLASQAIGERILPSFHS
ncbi:MAG: DUF4271 domain-containing protein [Flavobacteriales bacterium]|nr:MAG: DUF4271 domain-containing protein [Flavobacteriales bacterium]